MPANLFRVPGSVRACGRRLSHRCLLFVLQKNASQLPAKMLLAAFKKRKQNRCMGAQARKEGLQQTRGHWTTRRQMPTASTNAHRRAGGSCMAGHWFSADVCSSSRHRHCAGPELAGGRERSLALVAKVAVTMQSVLQTILPMCILYFARLIDRCARSETMP